MSKLALFFFVLPVVVLVLGSIFTNANKMGFVLALFVNVGIYLGLMWFASTQTGANPMLGILLTGGALLSLFTYPWMAVMLTFALPATAGVTLAEEVVTKYRDLPPHQKESVKQAGGVILKMCVRQGAETLRSKGHARLADDIDRTVG